MRGDVVQAKWFGVVDQQAHDTTALGYPADAPDGFLVDAFINELHHVVIPVVYLQRPVLGVGQLGGGLHDRAQSGLQFQARGDYQHRFHERVKAVTTLDDLPDAVLDFDQKLVQSQLRQRTVQLRRIVVNRRPVGCHRVPTWLIRYRIAKVTTICETLVGIRGLSAERHMALDLADRHVTSLGSEPDVVLDFTQCAL
jgi:hypothetical protein